MKKTKLTKRILTKKKPEKHLTVYLKERAGGIVPVELLFVIEEEE